MDGCIKTAEILAVVVNSEYHHRHLQNGTRNKRKTNKKAITVMMVKNPMTAPPMKIVHCGE